MLSTWSLITPRHAERDKTNAPIPILNVIARQLRWAVLFAAVFARVAPVADRERVRARGGRRLHLPGRGV